MVINPIVGVYIPIIRISIEGGMTIPNIATFDYGTYETFQLLGGDLLYFCCVHGLPLLVGKRAVWTKKVG